MCNIAEFKDFCTDSCNIMTYNMPVMYRGGTFIGNQYTSIKVVSAVPASEFVSTNHIENEKDDEGTSWAKLLGFRI